VCSSDLEKLAEPSRVQIESFEAAGRERRIPAEALGVVSAVGDHAQELPEARELLAVERTFRGRVDVHRPTLVRERVGGRWSATRERVDAAALGQVVPPEPAPL